MKKYIKVLAIVLAVVMAAMMPAQALSAVRSTKYISEVVTVVANSYEEAKKLLETAGYKIVENSNLNSTLKSGVYLGYKETTDKKEAITDVAAMNMTGKFSYSDYKQIMADYRENIEETVDNIEASIEEYQINYDAEAKNATLAYTALNLFKDDDSGKTMGEYFLEYDFSDASRESMTDTLMQANSDIVMSMIRALSFAGDTEDTTMFERMAETGPDGIEEKYTKVYPTVAKARVAMAAEYGTAADSIYKDWDGFYEYLTGIEKMIVRESDGTIGFEDASMIPPAADPINTNGLSAEEADFVNELNQVSGSATVVANMTDIDLYLMLEGTEFGEGTLLDFFKRPAADVDKTELYVIVDSMSEGQKGQKDFVDIKDILISAFSESEGTAEEAADAAEKYAELTEEVEAVSIFEGVDRSVFEDGVAFTSSAVRHESLTGQSWLDKLGTLTDPSSNYWNQTTAVCWIATAALFAVGIGSAVVNRIANGLLSAREQAFLTAEREMQNEVRRIIGTHARGGEVLLANDAYDIMDQAFKDAYSDAASSLRKTSATLKVTGIITAVSFVLMFVVLVYDIYTLVDYFMQEKPEEEAIPHHLMATAMTAYGEDYVYYQTVKTLSGDAADTNNHEADTTVGWLVLYTTKDENAGESICADDIKVVTGSTDFGEDASFAHLFNETAPVNLTDPNYTGTEDTADGTYIVFDHNTASYAGSAIAGGSAAMIAAAALAVGAAGGSIITAAIKKKKEA